MAIDAVVSRNMRLKKMENMVGARTHPFFTPLKMGKLPDSDHCATPDLADRYGADGGW